MCHNAYRVRASGIRWDRAGQSRCVHRHDRAVATADRDGGKPVEEAAINAKQRSYGP